MEQARWRDNPLSLTEIVYLETSSYCPRAAAHRFCPAHVTSYPPQHLPLRVISSTLEALAALGYDRKVRFHTSNEPLADPRMLSVVRLARELLPEAELVLFTNGDALSQQLADELVEAGMTALLLSAYNPVVRKRLGRLKVGCDKTILYRGGFSDKTLVGQYDAEPTGCALPCGAPLHHLQIGCGGEVYLCCRDWRRRYTFGSLRTQPLAAILSQQRLWDVYAPLRDGKRLLPLCQRCSIER
jgi:hypothetical protein